MRPPKPFIKAGAINLSKMDRLAEQSEKVDIYFMHISMMEIDPIMEELRELEELEFHIHRMCEEAWGEDLAWYNEEMRPDCRWSVGADDQEIMVWDFEKGGNRMFPRNKLDNPNFNISKIFEEPDTNRPRKSVQEGGYPILNNKVYNCWEWPATNWLQACLTRQLNAVEEGNAPQGTQTRINIQPTMSGYSVQLALGARMHVSRVYMVITL